MPRKSIIFLIGFALGIGILSCERLGQEPQGSQLPMSETSILDSIPLEYGELVAITTSQDPYVAGLWFERPDKTIVVVRVNYGKGRISPYVLTVPRR